MLDVQAVPASPTKLAPVSRLDLSTLGGKGKSTLDQLALLDGDKLGLSDSNGISPDGGTDAKVYVVRPGKGFRVPRLIVRDCANIPDTIVDGSPASAQKTKVVFEIVFRSPEAVIRAVGDMVRRQGTSAAPTLALCPNSSSDCTGATKHRDPIFRLSLSGGVKTRTISLRLLPAI